MFIFCQTKWPNLIITVDCTVIVLWPQEMNAIDSGGLSVFLLSDTCQCLLTAKRLAIVLQFLRGKILLLA